jgi:hypothetical protein
VTFQDRFYALRCWMEIQRRMCSLCIGRFAEGSVDSTRGSVDWVNWSTTFIDKAWSYQNMVPESRDKWLDHVAVSGNIAAAQLPIEHGADPEALDECGMLIERAERNKKTEMVEFLRSCTGKKRELECEDL